MFQMYIIASCISYRTGGPKPYSFLSRKNELLSAPVSVTDSPYIILSMLFLSNWTEYCFWPAYFRKQCHNVNTIQRMNLNLQLIFGVSVT